jgi:aspartate racemase
LATTGCIDANLYQSALAEFGIEALVPQRTARDRFMQVLARIKSGDTGPGAKAEMIALAQTLIDAGAEAIIAACTEVPLVLGPEDISVPFVNSTDCLVHATIAAARGDIE